VKRKRGASLVEVTVGLFIIIPLFLAIIDLSAIVVGQIVNDAMAKRAARAAAHQENAGAAATAAQNVVSAYLPNGIVTSIAIEKVDYDKDKSGRVIVETKTIINIPAPIQIVSIFQNGRAMHARATEPIVMLTANP
jgi:Flp pilus assembly protein TadG